MSAPVQTAVQIAWVTADLDATEAALTNLLGVRTWVRIPDVLDAQGQPLHESGFASVPGVYFAGLPFSISRRSGTIMAIAEEAALLVDDIQRRLDSRL